MSILPEFKSERYKVPMQEKREVTTVHKQLTVHL